MCLGASVWRQVSETCGNSSSVDFRTFTIAVQVCLSMLMNVQVHYCVSFYFILLI